ncbi:alpha/beta fold hydrolase [Thermodesulfobacteriota bacterium]
MDTPGVSKHLELENVTLHYLDYGGGGSCNIVLLHGGGANAHWFDWVGPLLARRCRVLALDLRGHGDSSWADPPVYTYDAYMDDIGALLDVEHIKTAVFMGHSMGGMLLVRYIDTRPQEAGALVVCDAMLGYSDEITGHLRQIGYREGKEYATMDDYIAHYRLRPEGWRFPQGVRYHIASNSARQLSNSRWAHKIDRRTYEQREVIDTRPFWSRIKCPVLVLQPEYNSIFSDANKEYIKETCPQVEFNVIAGAGHHLILDQPEQISTLVMEFLEQYRLFQD